MGLDFDLDFFFIFSGVERRGVELGCGVEWGGEESLREADKGRRGSGREGTTITLLCGEGRVGFGFGLRKKIYFFSGKQPEGKWGRGTGRQWPHGSVSILGSCL